MPDKNNNIDIRVVIFNEFPDQFLDQQCCFPDT